MNGSNRTAQVIAACLVATLALIACGPAADATPAPAAGTQTPYVTTPAEQSPAPAAGSGSPEAPADSPLPTPADAREVRLTPPVPHLPEMIPPVTPPPVTGEVPQDLLEAIVADLASRESISSDQIEVVRAEAVVWNDGSLGCPEPGVSYLQVQVDGYWVELEHGGRTYDYRATEDGYFRLCPLLAPRPPGSPESSE